MCSSSVSSSSSSLSVCAWVTVTLLLLLKKKTFLSFGTSCLSWSFALFLAGVDKVASCCGDDDSVKKKKDDGMRLTGIKFNNVRNDLVLLIDGL